ncbi:hypothetical protein RB597_004437 [Gaeumannomyces tritici]
MRDPFPIPIIPALSKAVEPLAEKLSLSTLPLHIHEVVAGVLLYTFVQLVVSPWISMKLWPKYYPLHDRGKRVSWDAHVVSMVQSCLINVLAVWVMFADEERWNMDREQRVWGYTGAHGMIQGLAAGYFVWDLIVTVIHLDVFGLGLLAHASSALAVYSFGFRPVLNYYATTFILYELSTPFLNIHWFLDKLEMTGTRAQLYNGICLITVFFSCRLVWGNYQSAMVYKDMWHAVKSGPAILASQTANSASVAYGGDDIMRFAQDAGPIPMWLTGVYLASNMTLNMLNVHWFFKMIKAVKKRFEPAKDAPKSKEKTPCLLSRATSPRCSSRVSSLIFRSLSRFTPRPRPDPRGHRGCFGSSCGPNLRPCRQFWCPSVSRFLLVGYGDYRSCI